MNDPRGLTRLCRGGPTTCHLCQGWARFECVEDDADEQWFEAADGFASVLAFGAFAFEVGAGGGVVAGLGDRDAVERGVELAIAAAVEPVALEAA